MLNKSIGFVVNYVCRKYCQAVTTYRLTEMKQRGEKIAMLTSYDYSMARIVDAAGSM